MTAENNKAGAQKPLGMAWRWPVLLTAAYLVAAAISFIIVLLHIADFGIIGIRPANCDLSGYCQVDRVSKESVAEKAGIKVGDQVRFDRLLDTVRLNTFQPNEHVGVTVRSAGKDRHVVLIAKARHWNNKASQQVSNITLSTNAIFATLGGVFLVMRSQGRRSILILGTALITLFAGGYGTPFWISWRPAFLVSEAFMEMLTYLTPLLFMAFAHTYRQEQGGSDGWRLRWSRRAYGLLLVPLVPEMLFTAMTGIILLQNTLILDLVFYSGLFIAFVTLITGWREADGETRDRYRLLIPALLLVLPRLILPSIIYATGGNWSLLNPLVVALNILPPAGIVLLAYTLLRHRVVDFGFAVNRTLVFGGVSIVILCAFGLSEWGIEKLLGLFGFQSNLWLDATIALGVFFAFHHIQGFIEKVVERLFFRKWHQNEEHMNRFVREAGFFHSPDALEKATVTEFQRFSGGADVRIYRREGALYLLVEGTGAKRIKSDQPAVVRLRANLKPLEGDASATLGASLVLPMVYRNEVTGMVLMGAKGSGDSYRPDEIQTLATATRKIGLDLHTLRIEELEQANAKLTMQLQEARLIAAGRGATT